MAPEVPLRAHMQVGRLIPASGYREAKARFSKCIPKGSALSPVHCRRSGRTLILLKTIKMWLACVVNVCGCLCLSCCF